MRRWAGKKFDPERFDLEATNKAIAKPCVPAAAITASGSFDLMASGRSPGSATQTKRIRPIVEASRAALKPEGLLGRLPRRDGSACRLHSLLIVVRQEDHLPDAGTNGEASKVAQAKAGASLAACELAIGAGCLKALRNPHGVAREAGGPGSATRIAQHHAMRALAGYRVQTAAEWQSGAALGRRRPARLAGVWAMGRAPSGKLDGTAHQAASR
jgi:hypothetical protein